MLDKAKTQPGEKPQDPVPPPGDTQERKTAGASTPPGNQPAERVDRNAATQVGQVIQGLGSKLTERLPTTRPRSRKDKTPSSSSRERINTLVLALGDTEHPDHATAIESLVEIGVPAVPALNDALNPQQSWLTNYRAAEALGRIGDGRATGALIQALRNPNSNVRWSAVRALAQVGDLRALIELRRVAQEDHGRTSWGESVAGAAQSALDQIQAQSIWGQSMELIKTAFTSVLMILALILAFSVVTTLHSEIKQVGYAPPDEAIASVRTPLPTETPDSMIGAGEGYHPSTPPAEGATEPVEPVTSTATTAPTPSPAKREIVGTVVSGANVRPAPSVSNEPIGAVNQGDTIIFLGVSPDGMWYQIRLDETYADGSGIDNPDGSQSGWIHKELVSRPDGDVPVVEDDTEDIPTPTPSS